MGLLLCNQGASLLSSEPPKLLATGEHAYSPCCGWPRKPCHMPARQRLGLGIYLLSRQLLRSENALGFRQVLGSLLIYTSEAGRFHDLETCTTPRGSMSLPLPTTKKSSKTQRDDEPVEVPSSPDLPERRRESKATTQTMPDGCTWQPRSLTMPCNALHPSPSIIRRWTLKTSAQLYLPSSLEIT